MADIFELKDMAKTAVSENDLGNVAETFNLILQNSSEALPEDNEFFTKIREALKLVREYKKLSREIETAESRRASQAKRLEDLKEELEFIKYRLAIFIEKADKKDHRGRSNFNGFLILVFAIDGIAVALWGAWTLWFTVAIVVIAAILYFTNKITNKRDLKKMIASTEKRVAEFDAELEAKKNEREKILSEYNKKADEIISMVS